MEKEAKLRVTRSSAWWPRTSLTRSAPFDRRDCYRTPLSGGHEFAGASDLVISPRLRDKFPFCVECKHRKNFRLEHVFDMVKDFAGYHEQVIAASAREGNTRAPMLVLRGNRGTIYCAVPRRSAQFLQLSCCPRIEYRAKFDDWVLVQFDRFLECIKARLTPHAAALPHE